MYGQDQFPRGIFGRVGRSASVVVGHAFVEIAGRAYIRLTAVGKDREADRLFSHGYPPCREARRRRACAAALAGYGGQHLSSEASADKSAEASAKADGAEGNRTPDLLHAMQALSQLSYSPGWGRRADGWAAPLVPCVIVRSLYHPSERGSSLASTKSPPGVTTRPAGRTAACRHGGPGRSGGSPPRRCR